MMNVCECQQARGCTSELYLGCSVRIFRSYWSPPSRAHEGSGSGILRQECLCERTRGQGIICRSLARGIQLHSAEWLRTETAIALLRSPYSSFSFSCSYLVPSRSLVSPPLSSGPSLSSPFFF